MNCSAVFSRAALSCGIVLAASILAVHPGAASGFRVLHSYTGDDGSSPIGTPAVDGAGNIYLATNEGGASNLGTVGKVTPGGSTVASYSFDGDHGQRPFGGVFYDKETDTAYGTTCHGGATDDGVVYAFASSGTLKVLHTFHAAKEGNCPYDAPYRDAASGTLYGTAVTGGLDGKGCGTIWSISAKGKFKVLHAFDCLEGGNPQARLIPGRGGILYGTTNQGGPPGGGTIYAISKKGVFTVLHNFDFDHDGALPASFLTLDKSGNLYGTTNIAGPGGDGTIFKLAPDGTLTVLYAFAGDANGGVSYSNLVLLKDKLYGTTLIGGDPTCNCGVVFEAGMDGSLKVLHPFTGPDGYAPFGGLVKGKGKYLYGTTKTGGDNNDGTLFHIHE